MLVRSGLKRRWLGTALMRRIIVDPAWIGVRKITGLVLRESTGMLRLARRLGFELTAHPDDRMLMLARRPSQHSAAASDGVGV